MKTIATTRVSKRNLLTPAVLLIALFTMSTAALAGPRNHYNDRHYNGGHVDYARVISVKPIYKQYRNPRRDYGYRDDYYYDKRSSTKPVLGAIIGGGLGHALGNNKSSKKVGAVAGAVLGAAIASDSQKKRYRSSYGRYDEASYCEDDYRREIVGYKVKYRYNGRTYRTRTDYDPGRRIKVIVDVRPAH